MKRSGVVCDEKVKCGGGAESVVMLAQSRDSLRAIAVEKDADDTV